MKIAGNGPSWSRLYGFDNHRTKTFDDRKLLNFRKKNIKFSSSIFRSKFFLIANYLQVGILQFSHIKSKYRHWKLGICLSEFWTWQEVTRTILASKSSWKVGTSSNGLPKYWIITIMKTFGFPQKGECVKKTFILAFSKQPWEGYLESISSFCYRNFSILAKGASKNFVKYFLHKNAWNSSDNSVPAKIWLLITFSKTNRNHKCVFFLTKTNIVGYPLVFPKNWLFPAKRGRLWTKIIEKKSKSR